MAEKKKPGLDDVVSATDTVEATVPTVAVAPEFPCPLCGKAMKDNGTKESKAAGQLLKICSNRSCRTQTDWALGSGGLVN